MSGVMVLRRLQLGREGAAAPGTPVVSTAIWRGLGVLEDERLIRFPEENVGLLVGAGRSYTPRLGAKITLPTVEATFEQLGYLLEMGILSIGTGIADGGGSGKIYDYIAGTTSKQTTAKYTVEGGDDLQKAEVSYVHLKSLTLEGVAEESLMMSAELVGRQLTRGIFEADVDIAFVATTKTITQVGTNLAKFVTGTTIKVTGTLSNDGIYTVATGGVAAEIVVTESLVDESAGDSFRIEDWYTGGPTGLSRVDVEEILFSTSRMYLDAVGGTIGSTEVSDTLLSMSAKFTSGLKAQPSASGEKYFSHVEDVGSEIEIDLVFLHNADAVVEMNNYENETPRQLRVAFLGTALTTAGAHTYKTFHIDVAGKWETFAAMTDDDGVNTVAGKFVGFLDPTASQYLNMLLVNEVTALP